MLKSGLVPGCPDAGTDSSIDTLACNNCREEGLLSHARCLSSSMDARSGGQWGYSPEQ